MTRDEILNMPAGREMDALIAEKVLGWTWDGFEGGYQRLYINDGEYRRYGAIREGGETEYTNNLHEHSTDMGAAWEVVEKMRDPSDDEPDFWVITDAGKRHGWVISSYWAHHDGNIENFHVQAETAPLAICRAALLAVMNL